MIVSHKRSCEECDTTKNSVTEETIKYEEF